MIRDIVLTLSPADAADDRMIRKAIATVVGVSADAVSGYVTEKRSIDARRGKVAVKLRVKAYIGQPAAESAPFDPPWRDVSRGEEVLIAGAGPAGLFAALKLITLGYKPVILERGKAVRQRRRDLAAINKDGVVNPESNYCFGEGGAGTYSDGKLYTRATKRGDVGEILRLFVHFGATTAILSDAHPHIGTNKLPQIISAMTAQIIACGGVVHFETKLTDILLDKDRMKGVQTTSGTIAGNKLILATGHSARDIYMLLAAKKILLEAKPFALGVRIEHPQALIDSIQYQCAVRDPYLPPASYALVTRQQGRGVFSFCMCPGGIIAPAATAPGEIVVNGWSPSKRNNPFANSGTVVEVQEADFAAYGFSGSLAGLQYQQLVEQQAWDAGGGKLQAPAQRMTDFVQGKLSATLPTCSYLPGIVPVLLDTVLPAAVCEALQKSVVDFGRKMKGYFTEDAVLVATESRTSAPVRIPRDRETLAHPQIKGLYPCAEGAGYAGGIISAAIDGQRCAVAAVNIRA